MRPLLVGLGFLFYAMIVEPDFLEHWKTRLLVRLLGTESAPIYVIRLWAHCQSRKTDRFTDWKPEVLASVCRWDGDAKLLWDSMIQTFAEINGEAFIAHGWAECNAALISAWSNGKLGGRPPKIKPIGNPQETHRNPLDQINPRKTHRNTGNLNPQETHRKPIETHRNPSSEKPTGNPLDNRPDNRPVNPPVTDRVTDREDREDREDTKNTLKHSPWIVAFDVELPESMQTQNCLEAVRLWLEYKKERKEGYKSTGLRAAVTKWSREFTPATFPLAVETSMANGWSGIFPPKDLPRAVVANGEKPKLDLKDWI